MHEIRFHGRGGTGAVMASRALAKAAFYAGKNAVSFPSFSAERRGALVLAFARINTKKIYRKSQIYEPDTIVVLDNSLIELIDVAKGLKPEGIGIINTSKKPEEIQLSNQIQLGVLDATKIAMETLGQPYANSAILGALIRSTNLVEMKELEKGILSVFGSKLGQKQATENVEAARLGYEATVFGKSQGGRNYSKIQPWLPSVDELPIGTILPKTTVETGQTIGPGSATIRITGTWSYIKADINQDLCIQCLKCVFHCPEGTIHRKDGKVIVNKAYCKACGICESICPVNAVEMIKIKEFSEIKP
ncbi:MAG: 2-oxoacid:acceptor oxidoreductase family protein [Candidatus Heimdallarchaeota archaeon]|nr:2-oxoacid:acceptor oxidoreductase family protein [Candidatus Heimdallarchaeota archaeon]